MTIKKLMELYTGGASISIKGYCEEANYDYYLLPDPDMPEEEKAELNCLETEPWWEEIQNRKVENFTVTGGGMYPMELRISLEERTLKRNRETCQTVRKAVNHPRR